MPKKKNVTKGTEKSELDIKPKYKLTFNKFDLTEKQKGFLETAFNQDTKMVFLLGPAGSSKTFCAVYAALHLFNMNNEFDIVYARTIAESAEKGLGSLPGVVEEKFDPFIAPLLDKLEEIVSSTSAKMLKDGGIISCAPVNYMRGASWKNKIVINDESQNFSKKELITLITRIGENTKYFICGDLMQSDINGRSGLKLISDLFDNDESISKGIHVLRFGKEDIMRSEILKFIIEKLEKLPKK